MNTSNPIQYKIGRQFAEFTVHELYRDLNEQTAPYDLYNDIQKAFLPISHQLNRQFQLELLIILSSIYPKQPVVLSQIRDN